MDIEIEKEYNEKILFCRYPLPGIYGGRKNRGGKERDQGRRLKWKRIRPQLCTNKPTANRLRARKNRVFVSMITNPMDAMAVPITWIPAR